MSRLLHLVINHSVVDHIGADIVAAHLRSVLLHKMENKIIYLPIIVLYQNLPYYLELSQLG